MKKVSKWHEANGQFMDLINEMIGMNPVDEMIEKSGQMLSYFSHFIVPIEEKETPEFRYFFQFMLTLDKSTFSPADRQKITSELLEVLRNFYPEFYSSYDSFDL